MEEITGDPGAVWHSNRNGGEPVEAPKPRATRKSPQKRHKAVSAGRELPDFAPPQLATLVDRVPEGPGWLHEVKLDGYRTYCRLENGRARFLTRRGLDWTEKFGSLARHIDLPARRAAIDGEVVVLDRKGVSDFGALQLALSERRGDELVFFAFDLLHLDGEDLRTWPLVERKERLKALFERRARDGSRCVYSEHFAAEGDKLYKSACRMGLEGIISKRAAARYATGRGTDWVKTKCRQRQEVVIGGFTERTSGPGMIGALLVGYRDGDRLLYAGKVGTGLTVPNQKMVRAALEPKKIAQSPFDTPVPKMRDVTWVRPDTVCEIEFHNWTRDGFLRQPSFQGLRLDKKAAEVIREEPVSTSKVEKPMNARAASTATQSAGKRKAPARAAAKPVVKAAPRSEGADPLARLTSPDKVLYTAQGLTKSDLAQYYSDIADAILPHLAGRPLALVRCPEGQSKECFFQKHPAMGMSPAIHRIPVRMKQSTETYLLIEDLAGLIELVQFGTLEIHPWGCRAEDVERPDRIIFDLDPDPSVPWRSVVDALHEIKDLLAEIGLRSFAKTTGGKGLHAVVPIRPGPHWPEVKNFARAIAETLATRSPDKYTTNMAKRKRAGRIFVDYLRNDRGATAIAPYSTRAREGAPVAVPLAWREVTPGLDPQQFTIHSVVRRLKRLKGDPWAELLTLQQPIDKHIAALER
jgi:bifunctional non-homologous end joining protein LigD